MEASNLYKTLSGMADKIEESTKKAIDSGTTAEMVHAIILNQKALSESIMMLAGVMQMVVDEELELFIESRQEKEN